MYNMYSISQHSEERGGPLLPKGSAGAGGVPTTLGGGGGVHSSHGDQKEEWGGVVTTFGGGGGGPTPPEGWGAPLVFIAFSCFHFMVVLVFLGYI